MTYNPNRKPPGSAGGTGGQFDHGATSGGLATGASFGENTIADRLAVARDQFALTREDIHEGDWKAIQRSNGGRDITAATEDGYVSFRGYDWGKQRTSLHDGIQITKTENPMLSMASHSYQDDDVFVSYSKFSNGTQIRRLTQGGWDYQEESNGITVARRGDVYLTRRGSQFFDEEYGSPDGPQLTSLERIESLYGPECPLHSDRDMDEEFAQYEAVAEGIDETLETDLS